MKKKKSEPLFSIAPDGTITSDHWVLTVREAATALGMKPNYLRQKIIPSCKTPFEIKPVRMGKKVRFRLLDIINYLKEKEEG
jgi:hypothetical protein